MNESNETNDEAYKNVEKDDDKNTLKHHPMSYLTRFFQPDKKN